jgi:flagellar basal-body rod modification protein FlgD
MQTNPTNPAASPLDALKAANSQSPTQVKANGNNVDKGSFLNLLVTQLRNQDPLDPVQNTEFISQLAQFQSLESQIDTGKHLEDLVQIQESQLALAGLSQAALLVGKKVTWTDEKGKPGSGLVLSVTVENGVMMINYENGKVPVGALTSIALPTPDAQQDPDAGKLAKNAPAPAPRLSNNAAQN